MFKKEEPKCPKCGIFEDTMEVCKNCGYQYPDEYYTFWDTIFSICKFLGMIAIGISIGLYLK